VTQALWLVSISVAFGALSGTVSVITGLRGHSLSAFAVGLGVLADVTGSAVLIWRFRSERYQPGQSGAQETRAAIIVSVALAVVSAVLIAESVAALVNGSRPGTSGITLVAAAISLAVLTPGLRQAPSGQADGQPRTARRWGPQRDRCGHQPASAHLPCAIPRSGLVAGRPDRRTGRRGRRRRLADSATPQLARLTHAAC
jgi:hypothetical protein